MNVFHAIKQLFKFPQVTNPDLDSKLLTAVEIGNIDAIRLLIDRGANPNARFSKGLSPLMFACASGNLDVIKCLVAKGADVDIQADNGLTPLMFTIATDNYNIQCVRYIVSLGADVNAKSTPEGFTPLSMAIEGDKYDCVQLLISNGADVDITSSDGTTALMTCCIFGRVKCLEFLLAMGANPYIEQTDTTRNAADLSAIYDHVDCLRVLISQDACSDYTLFLAAEYSVECLDLLVSNGADINTEQPFLGATPLINSAEAGNVACLKYLLSKGADINVKGIMGTPLDQAACVGSIACMDILISYGADVNEGRGSALGTPLMFAMRYSVIDSLESVEYLVSKGADVNATNYKGETALMMAVEKGKLDFVNFLISKGAYINMKQEDGTTALAIAQEQPDICMILKAAGAVD